jgi:hypothetical protein
MMEEDDANVFGRTKVGIEVTYWIASHVQPSSGDDESHNNEQGTTTVIESQSSKHCFDETNISDVRVGLPIGAEPVKVNTSCCKPIRRSL